ncbi:heme ABC transporter ATP-binding protein [Luteimicrobium xylanilyticum]|uniref:Fe(3+) ions import ATP-binding protein FbpC n=1 Tax=Luteimicrobium xylanilyticum TaxID=1133546 RepID=A0A5P9QEU2_9MICO|nr:heme ABC transporter ATP-binding protein [Luteimicrobium xylanilyticum]QFU99776.1 Fe(3+) ions import ATP-binding protein FbpC [Luteimicrobium xylanilyticum]
MSATVLLARGVGHTIDGHTILDGVDLEVRAGEVLALVGPNGAGKSTLLGVLAGDVAPTSGTLTWMSALPPVPGHAADVDPLGQELLAAEPLASLPVAELARRRAVLLQEQSLSFPFRVVDVVRMGRAPWARAGVPGAQEPEDDDTIVARALLTADVLHLAERRFPTLSGGEKARTAFARVLAQTPRLLLLDEPTAALDIRHQEHVLAQASARARAGDAVVVVLHDLSLAAAWADRVVVLERGRVAGGGAPGDVLTSALLSRVYDHPVQTLRHPDTGELLVLPVRGRSAQGGASSTAAHTHLTEGTPA